MTTKAEELAADIDAVLHGGQRAPDRYTKFVHLIEQYGRLVQEAAAEHFEGHEYATYGYEADHKAIAKAIREMPLP